MKIDIEIIKNQIKNLSYGMIRDKVVNIYLNVKNWISYRIFLNKFGNYTIPLDYGVRYFDNFMEMSTTQLDDRYIRRQNWGDYHPGDLHQWYDPNAVNLENGLNLSVTSNTKDITSYQINGVYTEDNSVVTIPNGVGLVTSKESFKYGVYEWNIKLPKGSQLWPAIWLSAESSWPPEIDIIEGYSDSNGKYGKNLNTNIHCGSTSTNHYGIGANRHGLFIDSNKVLNLICHWERNSVRIYYNGFLCRVLTNKKDLKWMYNSRMLVIMNNALRGMNHVSNESNTPLTILDFKYYS